MSACTGVVDWTKTEYGFYKREHPCLYESEDHKGLDLTNLAGWFTDYISFPYAPLDRIKAADTCDDPYLLNASKKLKENPDIFCISGHQDTLFFFLA